MSSDSSVVQQTTLINHPNPIEFESFHDFYHRHYLNKNGHLYNRRIQVAFTTVGGLRALYSVARMRPIKFLTSILFVGAGYAVGKGLFEKDPLVGKAEEAYPYYLFFSPYKLVVDSALGDIKLV